MAGKINKFIKASILSFPSFLGFVYVFPDRKIDNFLDSHFIFPFFNIFNDIIKNHLEGGSIMIEIERILVLFIIWGILCFVFTRLISLKYFFYVFIKKSYPTKKHDIKFDLVKGDILEQEGLKIIAVDTNFSTENIDKYTIHGKFLKYLESQSLLEKFKDESSNLKKEIGSYLIFENNFFVIAAKDYNTKDVKGNFDEYSKFIQSILYALKSDTNNKIKNVGMINIPILGSSSQYDITVNEKIFIDYFFSNLKMLNVKFPDSFKIRIMIFDKNKYKDLIKIY